ncbi:UNVERIFIED_CONTAM: hypothetical protein Sradi_6669400 [Sesamum radiatum]|uniref:Reverse transcriptase RNase H-like domain-containing protein n=1 Tax=Sesamum radiatum TaxID=300843 RepID=A0AAW2JPI6_SESRA
MPPRRKETQRGIGGQIPPPPRLPSPMRARVIPVHLLVIRPPRRSSFAPHILAEAVQPRIKITSLSEYSGVGDLQDHLALVIAARRLRPYFQSHPVVVLTNHPLKKVLADPNISRRMVKWSIKLSEHGIEYRPMPDIKAQSLADFILKSTRDEDSKKNTC